MILTVTPNTAIDRVIFVRDFGWGHTMRADAACWSPGGKGTDAAWILGELGEPCLAIGLAAAESGHRLQEMIEAKGPHVEFVWAEGETRTNYVLVDTARGVQATVTVSGLVVRPEHIAALDALLERHLPHCSALMLGGSVPRGMSPDWYGPWIHRARALAIPVLLDAGGDTLGRSAPAGPTVIKPNLDELMELIGRPLPARGDVVAAARDLLAWGIDLVLVSMGAEGAVAVAREAAWHLPALPVEPVNCAGAGDAMMSGLAVSYARRRPLQEGLRLAVAAATAVVITAGTAECHRADVERFLPQVRLEEIR